MNINIRTDSTTKEAIKKIFKEFGLSIFSVINISLRQTVRKNGILFEFKLNQMNPTTIAAIEEGGNIAADPNAKNYSMLQMKKKPRIIKSQ